MFVNTSRLAGAAYVVTIVAGSLSLFTSGSRQVVANGVAGASYVVVTLLFYRLFAPVNRSVSALAAGVSLAGCLVPVASALHWIPAAVNPLPIFGLYCILIGWLILNAEMPRLIGVLIVVGGIGWLTFSSAALARTLAPYNFAPGIVGESVLTGWLLVSGTQPRRRHEPAIRTPQ